MTKLIAVCVLCGCALVGVDTGKLEGYIIGGLLFVFAVLVARSNPDQPDEEPKHKRMQ